MTLTSDTVQPRVNVPFNVTVSIRVKENVSNLPDVYLPTFFGPEELGDVRSYTHGPGGTLYRETLTLAAHSAGPLSISSAYMDAIDARDGKPKRFFTNALRLNVQGGAAFDPWAPIRAVATFVLYAALLLAALFVFFAVFIRGRRPAAAPVALEQPAPPVPAPPEETPASAIAELRKNRTRQNVLRVRDVFWRSTGAGSGATLEDLRERPEVAKSWLWDLLVAVERAAFVEDAQMQQAIDDLLQRYDRSVFA